jgi:hypothetical protein
MKITSISFNAFLAISLIIGLTGCGGKKNDEQITDTLQRQEAEMHEEQPDVTRTEAGKPQFTVDEIFQKQLATVFSSYIGLKDAFVSSDVEKVKKEGQKTLEALANVDMKLVSGAAHNDWMTFKNEMEDNLKAIFASTDIEEQRQNFSKLSGSFYKTVKAFGLGGTTAYYEFCPMAFDDKGAYWLSDESKIRNPYFGDKMLTCGSVEETLK